MPDYDPRDIASILSFGKRAEGKTLGELVPDLGPEVSGPSTKGLVGHAVEAYFGLPVNSLSQPDFTLAGVELKIVPMRRTGRGWTVKERMSLTMINYLDIEDVPWEGSHLDHKTRKILMVFYGWGAETPIRDFKILRVTLWERAPLDEQIIRAAYQHVASEVRSGRAHLLSEGSTRSGVGPATKGASGARVPQPNSDHDCRPRAFAFKPSFTQAVWNAESGASSSAKIPVGSPPTIEEEFARRIDAFRGQSVAEIASRVGLQRTTAKNWLSTLSRRMVGAPPGVRDVEELAKLGIMMRTVRLDERGHPREAVSFPTIDFFELLDEEWESCALREHVSHLFFVVFRHERGDELERAVLDGAFFWRPSEDELAAIGAEWLTFRSHFARGTFDTRPSARDTDFIHVRPHGRNASDRSPAPGGQSWIKSSFWLNQTLVADLVRRHGQGAGPE